jgi:MoaA/NifB/PqqE/SkfB family radical SAM enzyme
MNIEFLTGWYKQENDNLRDFRWSTNNSTLRIETDQVFEYTEMYIGSPSDNDVKVIYSNGDFDIIKIKEGWHVYTIKFDKFYTFDGNPLVFENTENSRNLMFMLSNISLSNKEIYYSTDNIFKIKNIKSKWIDIVYVLHHDKKSIIELHTKSNVSKYPVFLGGERSVSIKINENDIIDNNFEFKIKKDSCVNLQIKYIINRENYYDFLGLKSKSDESYKTNLLNTKNAINNFRPMIQWFVTWKCNMTCNYCWQESAGSIYRNLSGKTIKSANEWADAFNRLNPYRLYLTGGEPTLYNELTDMIELLNIDTKLSITSNFGKTFDIEKWKKVNPNRFESIFFSLHPTQWKNPDDFFEKLEKFMQYFSPGKIGIEMVLHPDNVKLVNPKHIIDFSTKHGLASPHLDEFVDPGVSNLDLKNEVMNINHFMDSNFENAYKLIHTTKDSKRTPINCPAGWKKINVDFEGNVFTCMSALDRSKLFDRSAMPHYSPIGNVFDNEFQLNTEPILCWESFRCSACDYQVLEHSWTPFKNNFDYQLPIPE